MNSIIKKIALASFLLSSTCWAYYDVLDTGETLAPGKYKLSSGVQALTSTGGGNLDAMIDMGFQDEFGVRGIVGFGRTDYSLGAMFKWIPIPDVDNQPAVGFNIGLLYGKWNDSRDLTLRWEPLVSKKFVMDVCTLTPYASIPLGIRTRTSDSRDVNTDTRIPIQFVAGSQVKVQKWENLQFMGEVGVDLDQAYSYITVGAVWYFDEHGFELK
jgi:hypothetical protein